MTRTGYYPSPALDSRVSLRGPVFTTDATGATKKTRNTPVEVWASAKWMRGGEAVAAKQIHEKAEWKFVVRHPNTGGAEEAGDVTSKWELDFDGKVFEILAAVPIPGGRPEMVEIIARATQRGAA